MRILVNYAGPLPPVVSVQPIKTVPVAGDFTDAIQVQIYSPPPVNNSPAVASHDLWVQALDVGDSYRQVGQPVRIAAQIPAGLYVDRKVASGVDYAYFAVANAVNGTTTRSALVSDFRDVAAGITDPFTPTFTPTF